MLSDWVNQNQRIKFLVLVYDYAMIGVTKNFSDLLNTTQNVKLTIMYNLLFNHD